MTGRDPHAHLTALSHFLTIAEAAEIARISPKRLRNLMAEGTLREGVHYTRPTRLAPRFRRAALLAWLDPHHPEGHEGLPMAASKRRQAARLATRAIEG